ncbi:MAG: hypothetical protein AAF718_13125 [Pseudomonadota bacterium]
MLWQLQILLDALLTWALNEAHINVVFAMLCMMSAFDICPKRFAVASATLYILIALC